MNMLLRLIGGGLVMTSALIASHEYSEYAKKRLDQYAGLIALLSHAEGMISRFLASGDGLWRGFENEALEKTGLMGNMREGRGLYESFALCESKFALSNEAKGRIKDFLSGRGMEYREGEIAALSNFREMLEEEMNKEKESLEKSVKVTRAILLGASLAFLILII